MTSFAVKLAAFAGALAVAFGAAFAIGAAADPLATNRASGGLSHDGSRSHDHCHAVSLRHNGTVRTAESTVLVPR